MRRLCLTVAAASAVLSMGALTNANAMAPGQASGVRAAIEDSKGVQDVRLVCTHYWKHHRRHTRCFWVHHRHWH